MKKNKYPKQRASIDPIDAEFYARRREYNKKHRDRLDVGHWVVIDCRDHVYVNRIVDGKQQLVDAALQGFWPEGTMLGNRKTHQIVKIDGNGSGVEIYIASEADLSNVARRRYESYVVNFEELKICDIMDVW